MSASETTQAPGHARPLSPQRISEMAWGFEQPRQLDAPSVSPLILADKPTSA